MIMILEDNKWVEAGSEDQREIAKSSVTKDFLAFNKSDCNKCFLIGLSTNSKVIEEYLSLL
jgi:hypothetical protein